MDDDVEGLIIFTLLYIPVILPAQTFARKVHSVMFPLHIRMSNALNPASQICEFTFLK